MLLPNYSLTDEIFIRYSNIQNEFEFQNIQFVIPSLYKSCYDIIKLKSYKYWMRVYITMSRSKFSSLVINFRNNFSWQFISSHQTRCDSCIRIKNHPFPHDFQQHPLTHNELFIRIVMQYWCTTSFLSMNPMREIFHGTPKVEK